jgi:hypothetical protein
MRKTHHLTRLILLVGIMSVVVFIAGNLIRYPEILTMFPAESVIFLSIATALIVGYSWMSLRRTQTRTEASSLALRQGMKWGLLIGGLWAIEIWAGNIANPQPGVAEFVIQFVYRVSIVGTLLATLLGAAIASRQTGRFSTGVWVGLWSGMLSGLIVFGTFIILTDIVPQSVQPDPQLMSAFVRSGFTNYAAFSMSDSLEAMINHLWLGPFLGLIFGAIGGLVGQGIAPRKAI